MLLSIVLCLSLITGCDIDNVFQDDNKETRKLIAFDTVIDITLYDVEGGEVFDVLKYWIDRYENKFSTTIETSEISLLNNNSGTFQEVSPETFNLINRAVSAYDMTGGAFDIAVYPIVKAWGFTTDEYRIPSEEELRRLLMFTDSRKIQFKPEDSSVRLLTGMQIDLGGIAKGYIASKLYEKAKEKGVKSGLISLGGNVQAIGSKPDGSSWHIGIQHPDYENDYIGVLSINDEAAITSGGYQRFFERDGKRYHHIIDPSTGAPSDSDVISATVITKDGAMGDALSTAFYVMGSEKAMEFLEDNPQFKAVILTKDNKVLVSEKLKDSFELGERFFLSDLYYI